MHVTRSFARLRKEGFDRQAGFTLMELMVGMTIGMIATIVIVQVMSVFEAQKRATTGTADAQTNGGIALYSIGREAAMAGFPLYPGTDTPLSCTTTTSSVAGLTANTALTPVAITEVAAVASVSPATDKITIRYGNPQETGAAAGATAGVPSTITALVGSAATVGSNLGCQVGDITVINTGATCAISKVTAVSAAGVSPISVTLADTNGAVSGASLACVGAWNEVTYSVNAATGNLERTAVVNGVSTGAVPIVTGIVNIQAQYGISTAGNVNQISSWVDATTGGLWDPALITVANRNRIKAVRIAVVARNAKLEQSIVTTAQPVPWTNTVTFDGAVWAGPTIDLSPGVTKWNYYRYRVFETIVPLRNVIWSKDTL